jgi:hypothetical protein
MAWQDLINGLYESLGGIFILLSVVKLVKEKRVRGVSVTHAAFFTTWGFWNLYYYAHLTQWASWLGGIGVVTTNTLWVVLMIYYMRKEKTALR